MTKGSSLLTFRKVGLFLALVAISQLFLQLALLGRGTDYVVSRLPIDDTYYYLQTAWNTKQLGFVTFDGIHRTNGVQFLWFIVVFLLTFLASDKVLFLYIALSASFILNVLCYLVIWKIAKEVNRPLLALLLAGVWSVESFSIELYSVAMENSIHALVFWCVIWQVIVFLKRVHAGKHPNFIGLTAVLVLNAWSRLDSGLISAILFLVCVGVLYHASADRRHFLCSYGRPIILSAAVAAVGAMIMFTSFHAMAGSYMPVSGLVKSAQAGPEGGEFVTLWVEALRLSAVGLLSEPFGLVGMVAAIGLLHLENDTPGLIALRRIWYVLLGAWPLYHFLLLLSGALGDLQENFWYFWYGTPWYVFWAISFGLLIDRLVALIGGEKIRVFRLVHPQRGEGLAAAARLFAAVFAVIVFLFSYRLHFDRVDQEIDGGLYAVRYRAALWLDSHLSEQAVVASWNAGQIGYFSDRTVINLDGLMNDVEYYETVLLDNKPLARYLQENDVDYVVDYMQGNRVYRRLRPPEMDGPLLLESLRTFASGDEDGPLQVWRVIESEIEDSSSK